MTTRVLVTGGTGLLGRRVVPAVQDLGEVHTVGRSGGGERHHVVDLADRDGTDDLVRELTPSTVIHLAGGPRADAVDLYRDNVLSTVRLMDACAALADPPFVIVVGSAAEYGEGGEGPVTEDAPTRPASAYGWAKLASTSAAHAVARAGKITLAVARPFNIVAPDLPGSSPLGNIRRQLLEGTGTARTVTCGRLDVVRDFVPVGFVADAIAHIARLHIGGTTNICSGQGTELGAILEAAANRLGVRADIQQDPALLALPAPDVIVGDATRLGSEGVRIAVTPDSLAATLLS